MKNKIKMILKVTLSLVAMLMVGFAGLYSYSAYNFRVQGQGSLDYEKAKASYNQDRTNSLFDFIAFYDLETRPSTGELSSLNSPL